MSTVAKLVRTELKLFLREPLVMTFVFAFPVITVLVLIGSFDAHDDGFPVSPAHWYTAGYLAVIVAAVGLVMLPPHIAGYRERGVLRRFSASDFPRWSFAVAEFIVALVVTLVGWVSMLVVVGVLDGLPSIHAPLPTAAGLLLGATSFISIGLLLGAVAPTARSAQGIGLLVFFPVFLLGGGGPPPRAMGSVMRNIADVIPLTHVTRAIQNPWLGLHGGGIDLAIVAAIAVVCAAGWWKVVRL
jgi:ABC-2 type transport system permease protein